MPSQTIFMPSQTILLQCDYLQREPLVAQSETSPVRSFRERDRVFRSFASQILFPIIIPDPTDQQTTVRMSAETVRKSKIVHTTTRSGLVAILLATYNGEKYLDEQIRSILAQTYGDFVVIARDDDSNDRTAQILARW